MPGKQAAWIGLGLIGLPMAARLAAAGWRVRGYDINPQRLEMAAARGIDALASAELAIEGASLVFISMPTEAALIELAAKLDMPKSAILVDTTTAGPAASAKVAEKRIAYLRAPISGSVNLAETGALTTFVSGPKTAFDAARPALAAYSRAQIWLGEAEEARYAKLAVNLMVAVTAGMLGEALALAQEGNISWDAALDLLSESVVASPLLKYKLEPLRKRDYTPMATGALMLKDLDLIVEAARQAGIEAPLASEVRAAYQRMAKSQLAGEDFFSIVKRP